MPRVLLTGATGFVGHACLLRLCEDPTVEICAIARAIPPWSDDFGDRVFWFLCDLLRDGGPARAIRAFRPTHLLHLGWVSADDDVWSSPLNFHWRDATLSLVDAFIVSGGHRLVVVGSAAEYIGSGRFAERDAGAELPATIYGRAKHETRTALQHICDAHGLSFAWPRVFNVYGPREHPRRFVAGAISQLLQGEPFRCTSGEQVRDYLDVADVADALVALLWSSLTGPVNIGSGDPLTLERLVVAIATIVGRRDLVRLGEIARPPNEPDVVVPDVTLQRATLAWSPRIDLESGLARTTEWWRERLCRG